MVMLEPEKNEKQIQIQINHHYNIMRNQGIFTIFLKYILIVIVPCAGTRKKSYTIYIQASS